MKKSTIIWIGIAVVVVLLIVNGISVYNRLVTADESVNAKWAEVDNNLQRRYDLIPNLVNTVRGYASHESEVLLGVTEARSRVGGATTPSERMQAEGELSSALSRLMVVMENYPQLQANTNFIRLQDELSGTENRLTHARRNYIEAVQSYNSMVRRFPANIIAGFTGFGVKEVYEVPDNVTEAPQVQFD